MAGMSRSHANTPRLTPQEVRRIVFREAHQVLCYAYAAPQWVVLDKAEDLCVDLPARYDPARNASEHTFIQAQARFRLSTAAKRCPECKYGVLPLDCAVRDCRPRLPVDPLEPARCSIHLQGLLRRLPALHREAVVLHYLQGYQIPEMRAAGVSNYRLREGLRKLREMAAAEGL